MATNMQTDSNHQQPILRNNMMHIYPSSDDFSLIKYEKHAEVGKNNLSLLPNKLHLFRGFIPLTKTNKLSYAF